MCTQTYSIRSRGQEKQCPYVQLYENWRASSSADADEGKLLLDFPIDQNEKCIFHSSDLEWKLKNDFGKRFRNLIHLANQDPQLDEIDLRAFVFVGDGDPLMKSKYRLEISGLHFNKPVVFDDAKFMEAVRFKNIEFNAKTDFIHVEFLEETSFNEGSVNGVNFEEAIFNKTTRFNDFEFPSYAQFTACQFLDGLKIENCNFRQMAFFDQCSFQAVNIFKKGCHFTEVVFGFTADFTLSKFECFLLFEQVEFHNKVDFIDTQFNLEQTHNPLDSSVDFKDIQVLTSGVLNFTSTNSQKKLFKHDVNFRYTREQLLGLIRFENVNFQLITKESKKRLLESAKTGQVEIGKGCLKYRLQTDLRKLQVDQSKQGLILEITQTFANYFIAHNGFNLGIEIVDRTEKEIAYFFFSDENISQTKFEARISETERSLWSSLFIKKTEIGPANNQESSGIMTDKLLKEIDGISALMGTFFRLGARINLNKWSQEDTEKLIKSISFNSPPVLIAENLHLNVKSTYGVKNLIDLSTQNNQNIKRQINLGDQSVYIEKAKGSVDVHSHGHAKAPDIENESIDPSREE